MSVSDAAHAASTPAEAFDLPALPEVVQAAFAELPADVGAQHQHAAGGT